MSRLTAALLVALLIAVRACGVVPAFAGSINNPAGAQILKFSASLTPAATSAAIQTAEQTFTVTGLLTTDTVYLNGPAPTSLCPPTTARVSATNTLAIGFTVLTAVACTPTAGTYKIVAIR
jgi:hypothetical protein